jgi:peptidoglycan hydrolase-like protein with peptidoglycan-binding domain
VVALKKALSDLGFFSLEVNNNYFDGELKKALIRFQESSSVISSSADYGAGFFGEKTRTALETALKNPDLKVTTQEERKEKVQMQIVAGISKNSLKEDVKNLQTVLKNLGYYSGDIHGEYNEDLINAIFAFQLDSGVVDSEASLGAGSFGPKTFAALENVIVLRKEKLKSFPQSKFSLVEALEEENKQQKFVSVDTGNFPDFKFKEYASQFAYGDTGNEVLSLQKTLVAYGLLEEKHATGFFGNITKTALEKALM